jgi:LuxR family maltose regulon positive regulatory protein
VPRVKIAVPAVSPRYLPRSRLTALLDSAAPGQLTLLSAPAGYGKTQLLADSAARRRDRTAWVSLDSDDRDDHRFWSAVLAALSSCPALPCRNPLRGLTVPARPSADPVFLAEVVGALHGVPGPIELILDDVHELTAPGPLRGLAALVRDRPPQLRLVLSGRVDPPLHLGRMRLAGQLCEIRARELRFSVSEATEMLAGRLTTPPEQIRLLVEHTDGWAAGLLLAEISLRDAENPDQFLAELVDNSRALSDYLVEEILTRIPPATRELLRAVSVCEQLTAGLASALSGQPDAGERLGALEHDTSLVVSYGADRGSYRVHPLLRAHMAGDLRRERPDLVEQLHGRAADWYAAHGQPLGALEAARRAGEPDRLHRLLRQQAMPLIAGGDFATVSSVLDGLGPDCVGTDPWLSLLAALVALERGDLPTADLAVAAARAHWPPAPGPALDALHATVRGRRAALGGDPRRAPDPVDGSDPAHATEPVLVSSAMLDQATTAALTGARERARALAETALHHAGRNGWNYLVARSCNMLATLAAEQGDLHQMTVLAERARQALPATAVDSTQAAAGSAVLRAYGALLRAQPGRSLELLTPALAFLDAAAARPSPPVRLFARAIRGTALFDQGHRARGLDELAAARVATLDQFCTSTTTATIALVGYPAAASLGRVDLAREILSWAQDVLDATGEVALLHARRQAALGRHTAADESLAPVLDGRTECVLPWTVGEAWVLRCSLALRLDRRPLARNALDSALRLATAQDAPRPLASAPPTVIDLLTRHLGSFGELEPAAASVLAVRSPHGHSHGHGTAPVSLTDRERSVLAMLPSQRTLHEIATDLTVAPSTVKTHIRAIYTKLGASSRRDAVAAARRQGILLPATPP